MGYFHRKVNRGRALREVEAIERQSVELAEQGWERWDGKSVPRGGAPAFVRFSIAERNSYSGQRDGVFGAAYRLLEDEECDLASKRAVRAALSWFDKHLEAHEPRDERAIFYFKARSPFVRRVWEMLWILHEHGYVVDMQCVRNPGRIVFEDQAQVAAVPWRDQAD